MFIASSHCYIYIFKPNYHVSFLMLLAFKNFYYLHTFDGIFCQKSNFTKAHTFKKKLTSTWTKKKTPQQKKTRFIFCLLLLFRRKLFIVFYSFLPNPSRSKQIHISPPLCPFSRAIEKKCNNNYNLFLFMFSLKSNIYDPPPILYESSALNHKIIKLLSVLFLANKPKKFFYT